MRLYFGLIAVSLAFAALCGVPLMYDGSWYLFRTLDLQAAYIPHNRYVSLLFHWPILWTSYVTSDLRILRLVFSATYAILPLLTLLSCWWILREERRTLFVWVAASLGLAVLPGQVLFASEVSIANQMVWLVWLAVILQMPQRAVVVVVPAAVVLFLSHPVAAGYFLGCAGLALLIAMLRRASRRRMLVWSLIFFGLAVGEAVMFALLRDPYETSELSLAMQLQHYHASAAGLPTVAILLVWLGGLLLLLRRSIFSGKIGAFARTMRFGEIASISLAGVVFMIWARDPTSWRFALDFRDLATLSLAPFMLFAALEVILGAESTDSEAAAEWAHRLQLTQIVAVVFLVTLGIQSAIWYGLRTELSNTIESTPEACIPASSISWLDRTPLYHWATPTLSIVLQSRAPEKIVLEKDDCSDPTFTTQVRINPTYDTYRPRTGGWFDFSRTGLSPGR